jgi:glycosyltransferase involved in cell wall biosynthesis
MDPPLAQLERAAARPASPAQIPPPREAQSLRGVRVCVVYDCLFPWTVGGAERWYRVLAEELAVCGASVTYLTRRQWPGDTPDVPGVDVTAVSGPDDLYDEEGGRKLLPPVSFAAGVLRWLARHRGEVDIVHMGHFPFFPILAARLALWRTDVDVYVDWHEVWTPSYWRHYAGPIAGSVGAVVEKVCVRLCPNAMVFWDANAKRLRNAGYTRDITVLAGLLPERSAGAGAVVEDVPSPPVIAFAGRFIRDKAPHVLPEMLAAVRRHIPDAVLIAAGDGPEHAKVQRELSRRGLDAAATLIGFVPEDRLQDLLRTASCLVVPSTREGYGMVVVEAAAYGTPSIVAANPENAAVGHIIDGTNGFVAGPSPAGLAEGVVRAIGAGPPLRASTADWYRSTSQSSTIHRSARQVVDAYERRIAMTRTHVAVAAASDGRS